MVTTIARRPIKGLFAGLCLCFSLIGITPLPAAEPSIAILDFELNDLTLLPNTPEERARTASIRPMVEQTLSTLGAYRLVAIEDDAARQANAGLGYLYDHPESAAPPDRGGRGAIL